MRPARIVGVLLAGGQARRMGGGDKCLRRLGHGTLLDHAVARARPQVEGLVLSANGDPARFAGTGLPVVADEVPGASGPLAGVLAGMEWTLALEPDADWIVSFATDTPFFPLDLVTTLARGLAAQDAEIACAASQGRRHPVFALWPVRLAAELRRALAEGEAGGVGAWAGRHRVAEVDFPARPLDPFLNVNTPEDLAEAERLLALARPAAR